MDKYPILKEYKEGLSESTEVNKPKNGLKKLQPLAAIKTQNTPEKEYAKAEEFNPKSSRYDSLERTQVLDEKLSIEELSKILPKIKLPSISLIIKNDNKTPPRVINAVTPRKIQSVSQDLNIKYKVDNTRQVLIVGEGKTYKEYPFNSLVDSTTRTNKVIDKAEAVEIANVYLKLKIPSQNKKSIFIKAIREKLGLDSEDF